MADSASGSAAGVLAVRSPAKDTLLSLAAAAREPAATVVPASDHQAGDRRLPTAFWTYAASTATTTAGLATFGVLSFHLVPGHLLSAAWVPVLHAAAMATGWLYDRHGPRVPVALPVVTRFQPCPSTRHTPSPRRPHPCPPSR